MNHKVKSLLSILALLGILALIGLMVGKEGLTGATTTPTISCFEDQDCNDKIAETEDRCRNPGTEYSLCVNRPKKE